MLRCPASGRPLSVDSEGWLVSDDGAHRYPVRDGIPVLLASGRSVFDSTRLGRWGRAKPESAGWQARLRRGARRLLDLPPTASRSVGSAQNFDELLRLLTAEPGDGQRPRVLIIGGGEAGVGTGRLLSDPRLEVVETDVFVGSRTQIVCDAHDLPFADGSFRAVVCQAVLEHVLDPWRAAQEVWRVLEPDGYVYSEVPFMQQVHEGAFDFTRFTVLGHRRLWRHFDEIRSGAQGGPGMALIWSISYFFRSLLPRALWALADRLSSLMFFWLKYFDDRLVNTPGGLDAASGTFFLGRRRLEPVDDRSIIRGYRGGGPRVE